MGGKIRGFILILLLLGAIYITTLVIYVFLVGTAVKSSGISYIITTAQNDQIRVDASSLHSTRLAIYDVNQTSELLVGDFVFQDLSIASKEQGYFENNISLIEEGDKFRRYVILGNEFVIADTDAFSKSFPVGITLYVRIKREGSTFCSVGIYTMESGDYKSVFGIPDELTEEQDALEKIEYSGLSEGVHTFRYHSSDYGIKEFQVVS